MGKKKSIILEGVEVESYAAEGKSLAKVDGKVVFIEKVVPGDIVDIRLTKNRKDWAEGYPLQFHSYSRERVDPFCGHFGTCGGCQWQMLPYPKQLQYKEQQVRDALKRIGKIHLPEISPIIGADETRFYRNKLEYTFSTRKFIPAAEYSSNNDEVRNQKTSIRKNAAQTKESSGSGDSAMISSPLGGGWEGASEGASGFHARGFFDKVVEIDTCYLQPEPTNTIRKTITGFARANGFSFYDFKEHKGFLRNLQLRICTSGEVMVNVIFGEDDKEKRIQLLNHLLNNVTGITTLLFTINTKWNDSIHDLQPEVYSGKGFITEKLDDFQFKIGPKSFFQTNTKQAEKLYSVARDFAGLTGNENVYDLYCGTGSIGIFISRLAKKIIGVEMIDEAVKDARENAALNNISHAAFFTGDVIKVCNEDFFSQHGKPDVIITDPPRAGMHEKLMNKILEIQVPVVVYVSCNPSTQARDLALLDGKYTVTAVQPVDMFPHTHHIENVVQLKLRN